MKVEVLMPEMGESITEGTVAKWLRKPGDRVERDETLLEITTDKIDSEIPAPRTGLLAEILVEEGETVEIGSPLAYVTTDDEDVTEPDRSTEAPVQAAVAGPQPAPDRRPSLSPVARNIAAEQGLSDLELAKIKGTGQKGKLTKDDLLRYLDQKQTGEGSEPETAEPADEAGGIDVIEMSTVRRTIAERMVQSKRISPHTYTVAEVDMTGIVDFREKIKWKFENDQGFNITYTHFILHATTMALKAFPLMNSSLEGEKIIQKKYINLGVAVAMENGLIVPVIKGAGEKNLLGLARTASELADKVKSRKLTPEDVQDGTFTVTNPGVYGNIFGLPIINQPQLGILGVGAIRKRPVVVNDAIAIRSIMYISLSYDHRVIDGSLSAQFVQAIRGNLENYDTAQAI